MDALQVATGLNEILQIAGDGIEVNELFSMGRYRPRHDFFFLTP